MAWILRAVFCYAARAPSGLASSRGNVLAAVVSIPQPEISLSLFHHDALAGLAALINEENPVFLFEPISNRCVDLYPARIDWLSVVSFDTNDRPPHDSHKFSQLRLF
jgi:hypothetical protein